MYNSISLATSKQQALVFLNTIRLRQLSYFVDCGCMASVVAYVGRVYILMDKKMNQKNKISIQNGTFKYLQIAFLQDFGGCKTTNNQRIKTKAFVKNS